MPRIRRTIGGSSRVFDARPDRADLRDRRYAPRLVSLPPRHPDGGDISRVLRAYAGAGLVGDQGDEGSCTGWGLRAVVNYLLWRRQPAPAGAEAAGTGEAQRAPPEPVSARMLYHLARVYDEWDGEDYEGSSCRGAMKGWHRHGVCSEALWPYVAGHFERPRDGWEEDAAQRPLGAYYRIEKARINDLQAAIHEVGAVYASVEVHAGWGRVAPRRGAVPEGPPLIPHDRRSEGGHALCLVGYTEDGFIVQNSWGTGWGFHGFAVLPYEDWVANAMDAWVAVLGAPMRTRERSGTRQRGALAARALGDAPGAVAASFRYARREVEPLSHAQAMLRSVVVGNEGRPLRRLIEHEHAADGVRHVVHDLPHGWFGEQRDAVPKLAVYAHGGLNDEAAGLTRARFLAPYFEANGIRPLFVVWRTGLLETLSAALSDVADAVLPWRAGNWLADAVDWAAERKDRSVEYAARIAVKPLWTEMKENAALAAKPGGALTLIADRLSELRARWPKIELHLVGHSAGGIVLGHLLPLLSAHGIAVRSLHLYAPACTLHFAREYYVPQCAAGGVLEKALVRVHNLSDARELDDSAGPYGKSLLYLVSRALEPRHKTPLLGMARAWSQKAADLATWNDATVPDVREWAAFVRERGWQVEHDEKQVSDGRGPLAAAHGAFDNDVRTVGETLRAIRRKPLAFAVENLRGF
jgi:hypothetical protein